ncbi:MAG TPA: RnfH family protein [Steroidobacteraceae bacterium]|jgi:putative ubiquitin-RnfH superfamily antitoxin RatB of RatAB toxin-antitoxin module|nr:RnfH family protein [Steroidobacteraceae bacterium]
MSRHCSVVWDTAQGLLTCELCLAAGATVAEALAAAQQQLGAQLIGGQAVGIFGQLCSLDQVLAEGDRIELYRPLRADPRAARRARAARGAGRIRRGRGI